MILNVILKVKAFLNNAYNDCKVITHLPIKYPCKYAIKVDDTFVFHPLKYVLALKEICLKRGINIYEKTKIIDLEKKDNYYLAKTNNNVIKAKKVVLACHYPFFITPSFFPFKTYLEKSYVASGIVDKNKKFNAISCNDSTHSIRYYSSKKDYLIYAGLSKSLGYNMNNEKNFHDLFWHIQSNLTTDIKYSWFNYDVITPDGLPLIGYYNKDQNLLIGTGYNTWGMTNGSLAGKILSDLILDKKNKYQELFDPNRQINISKIINMIGSNVDTGLTYITSKLKKNYSFYPDNIKIVYRHGKRCGIYTDHLNKEHVVNTLCPHMKCNLIFNNIDKTWDCPCHGSRFDIDGKVIKGPSVYNISVK